MPYTIAKGALWFALALLLGLIVGYLLRSIVAQRQIRAAQAKARPDTGEVDILRGRIANLEPVVAERDRLRAELEACRAGAETSADGATDPADPADDGTENAGPSVADASTAGPISDGPATDGPATDDPATDDDTDRAAITEVGPDEKTTGKTTEEKTDVGAETDADDRADTEDESNPAKQTATVSGGDLDGEISPNTTGISATPLPGEPVAPPDPDVSQAQAILGKPIKLNDLTVVEGIGPAIAKLCNGIGIHTWFELANTEVSLLQTMLDDAGSRYRVHHPDSWPQQGQLLANGQWEAFQDLVARLEDGRLPE